MNHARAHAVPLRLIDGPLVDVNSRRSDIVKRMAVDLVRFDAFRTEHDAIRSLYGSRSYSMADIVMCVDDARQAAMSNVVSAEMVEP